MEYAGIVAAQVAVMFILIAVGFVCAKIKMITDEGRKQMSAVVLNVVTPALIFMSYQKEFSAELTEGLLWSFLLSAATYVITIPLAYILIRKKNNTEYAIERFSLIFTNCGFMGIPLVNAVFGSEGVLYVTAYVTLFNFLVWTFGIMMIKNEMNFKAIGHTLKSPTVISIVLGLICYFTQLKIPKIFGNALNFAADMNTPLPMLVAGATMAQTDLIKAVKNLKALLISFYRLLVFPLICALVLKLFNAPQMVYTIAVIASACPTATTLIMFAIKYDKNDKYASELFSITTLLSAVSLPLVLVIVNYI